MMMEEESRQGSGADEIVTHLLPVSRSSGDSSALRAVLQNSMKVKTEQDQSEMCGDGDR